MHFTSVSAIVADSQIFNGRKVCLEGSVSKLKFKHRKEEMLILLIDGNGKSLNIFSHGTPSIKEGDKVKVKGRYEVEKPIGRYTLYEIDAGSVKK